MNACRPCGTAMMPTVMPEMRSGNAHSLHLYFGSQLMMGTTWRILRIGGRRNFLITLLMGMISGVFSSSDELCNKMSSLVALVILMI